MGVRVPQIDRGAYAFMPESAISFDKSRGGKVVIIFDFNLCLRMVRYLDFYLLRSSF